MLSECIREECADVAMVMLGDAQREWQHQEELRILGAVGKIVGMEIESAVVMEQLLQVALEVLRYICITHFSLLSHISRMHTCHISIPSPENVMRNLCLW